MPLAPPACQAMRLAEAHQALGVLVPERQAEALQAVPQRQAVGRTQLRMVAQHRAEPVARDARREMVDVMDADVGGEPAQHRRQVEMRAALHRTGLEAPARVPLPVGVLVLVLDVEQPDADRRGQPGDRRLHQQEVAPPHQRRHGHDHARDREIGREDAAPGVPPGRRRRRGQPLLEDEDADRADTEHGERAARQPVGQPPPGRQPPELGHGQRVDVADATPVEVAGGGMMDGVLLPPVAVGGQGQHADHPTEPVVGAPAAEERAVPAIVLDHEQAHQEARGGDGQQQAEPVGVAEAQPHQAPQGRERQRGHRQLDQAAGEARLPVPAQQLLPATVVVRHGARGRVARLRRAGQGSIESRLKRGGGHEGGSTGSEGGPGRARAAVRGGRPCSPPSLEEPAPAGANLDQRRGAAPAGPLPWSR